MRNSSTCTTPSTTKVHIFTFIIISPLFPQQLNNAHEVVDEERVKILSQM